MSTLYIVSIGAFSGKTGLSLALGLEFKERGLSVGYMKPVGSLPLKVDDGITDLDARFVSSILETGDPDSSVAPVVLTEGFMHARFKGGSDGSAEKIGEAFERVSRDRDVVIMEGGADSSEGRFIGVTAQRLAEKFKARVLIVAKFHSELVVDNVLCEADDFGKSLLGVVFNMVPRSKRHLAEMVTPYLGEMGIKVLGILPRDRLLLSVSVGELTDALGGAILTAKDKTSEMVETFMVGAMGQEKALRFFQRSANKAVITGGDRADVQLAALETPTKCLILTGNLEPSPLVLARAEELGVPTILVEHDTLTTVSITESLVGTVRVHQPSKVERVRELVKEHVDVDAILRELGV